MPGAVARSGKLFAAFTIMLWNSLVAATGLALVSLATAQGPSLPIVDLGYELHQASFFNVGILCHRNRGQVFEC